MSIDFPSNTKLDDDQVSSNKRLKRKYFIFGFPTVLMLDHKGKKLGRIGYGKGRT